MWHSRSMLEATLVTNDFNLQPLSLIQNLPKINVSNVEYLLRFHRSLCSLWEHPIVDSSCALLAHFTRFTTILSSLAQMSKNEGNSWMTQMIWCHPAPRWLNLDMVVIPWCSQGSYLSFAILTSLFQLELLSRKIKFGGHFLRLNKRPSQKNLVLGSVMLLIALENGSAHIEQYITRILINL